MRRASFRATRCSTISMNRFAGEVAESRAVGLEQDEGDVDPRVGRCQEREERAMKWVTRENVQVDRVACPWLIKKFVDPKAEFLFVPVDQVMTVAEREGAIPYDVKGVEL